MPNNAKCPVLREHSGTEGATENRMSRFVVVSGMNFDILGIVEFQIYCSILLIFYPTTSKLVNPYELGGDFSSLLPVDNYAQLLSCLQIAFM